MNAWTSRRAAAIALVGACWIAMGAARAAESPPALTLLVSASPQAGSRELVLTAWVQRAPAGAMVSFREVGQESPWSSGLHEIDRGRAQATAPAADRGARRFQAVLLDAHEHEQALSAVVGPGAPTETVRQTTTTVSSTRRIVDTDDRHWRTRHRGTTWLATPSTIPAMAVPIRAADAPVSRGVAPLALPAPVTTTSPAPRPAILGGATPAPASKAVAQASPAPKPVAAPAPAPALKAVAAPTPAPAPKPVAAPTPTPTPKPAAAPPPAPAPAPKPSTASATRSTSTSTSSSRSSSTSKSSSAARPKR